MQRRISTLLSWINESRCFTPFNITNKLRTFKSNHYFQTTLSIISNNKNLQYGKVYRKIKSGNSIVNRRGYLLRSGNMQLEKVALEESLNEDEKKTIYIMLDTFIGKRKLKDTLSDVLQEVK